MIGKNDFLKTGNMKLLIIALMLLMGTVSIMDAQISQVPQPVQSAFKDKYSNAGAVEWKVSGDQYKVMFTDKNNLHHTLLYNKDAKVISRESELDDQGVPTAIREYFIQNIPQEK